MGILTLDITVWLSPGQCDINILDFSSKKNARSNQVAPEKQKHLRVQFVNKLKGGNQNRRRVIKCSVLSGQSM